MTPTKTITLLKHGVTLCFTISISLNSFSQSKNDSLLDKLNPQKFAASVGEKAKKLEDKLTAKSRKVLTSMEKQEEKIYRKLLSKKDSLIARSNLLEIKNKYSELKDRLKNPPIVSKARQYIPKLDSLTSALKLLNQGGNGEKVNSALASTIALQNKFQQAEEIKKFIRERREQLTQQLEKLGMVKQLKQINKQVYYYAAQIKEYKEILKDPKKIEKKALELLSKTKLFQDFFKKNSMLASLFRMPGDPNDPAYMASLSGLQTRSQVTALVQQQIRAGGPNAQMQFQQQMQSAQSQLKELQNKFLKGGGSSSDDIMPQGFKPNTEKTKSFKKRIEYATNIQTQKSTNYFPTTSDLGLSAGYKLNDKSIIGVGASFKLGLGNGWQHIRFSGQGVGLRSYIDWKIKGSLWVSGGFEMNYKTAFNNIDQLRLLSAWQRSGLLGISKSVPVKLKFFKKTKVQLLWDFLSYRQVPRTQAIIMRFNYSFK
jgi:hypothetical protein